MNTSTANANASGTAEEPEPDADQHRIDRRDRGRSADVAAEHLPRAPARTIDRVPHLGAAALQDPGPESRAVAQDEVERHRERLDSLTEALMRAETLDQPKAYAAAGLTAPVAATDPAEPALVGGT